MPALTSSTDHPTRTYDERAMAVLARDAAIGRIGRARRWMLMGAMAMTAGLALLASSLLPGKSLGASGARSGPRNGESASTPSTHRTAATVGAPALPSPAGPSQLGLEGPVQAPQSSPPSSPGPTQSSPPAQSAPPVQPSSQPAASSGGGAVVSGGS
jgi:hypothetical protein